MPAQARARTHTHARKHTPDIQLHLEQTALYSTTIIICYPLKKLCCYAHMALSRAPTSPQHHPLLLPAIATAAATAAAAQAVYGSSRTSSSCSTVTVVIVYSFSSARSPYVSK